MEEDGDTLVDICIKSVFNVTSWIDKGDSLDVLKHELTGELTPKRLKDLFHFRDKLPQFPTEGNQCVPKRMDGRTSEELTANILSDMCDLNYKELEVILQDEVPAEVNSMCTLTESILGNALTEACSNSTEESGVDRICTSSPKFHEALLKYLKGIRDNSGVKTDREILCLLNILIDIASDSADGPAVNKSQYHQKWTLFIHTMMNMLVPYQMQNKSGQRVTGECSIYGMSQLGFPIYDGNKASRLSCIPDYVAAITQTERYGTSSMLKIYQTVLVIDIKRTCTHSSGYVAENKKGSSSSWSDLTSNTSQYEAGVHDKDMEFHQSSSDPSTGDHCDKDSTKHKSWRSVSERTCRTNLPSQHSKSAAEKQQLAQLNTQHLIQLIGLLKISMSNLAEARHYTLRFITIDKKPASYGLLVLHNHVYLTKLSVVQHDTIPLDLRKEFIEKLGVADTIRSDGGLSQSCSLNYKISDGHLDLFVSEHLKAFLNYLRVLIWHEQKFLFKRT